MDAIWIGTSGWSYKGWAELFYPPGGANQLSFYITQFPTVEINATFYRLPSTDMVKGWRNVASESFLFSIKGSRYITHMKKLVEAENGLERFFERIRPLGAHLGPILWQLPPFLKKSVKRLDGFLHQLPGGHRYAIEFRHPSWIDEEVFAVLRAHNAACVWVSSWLMPLDFTTTADFVYARFHGLTGGAAHDYSADELAPWAQHLSEAARQNKAAFAYFNNDVNARAPQNATLLMQLVGELATQPKAEPWTSPQRGTKPVSDGRHRVSHPRAGVEKR